MRKRFRFLSPERAAQAHQALRDEYLEDCLGYCEAVTASLRVFLADNEASLTTLEFDTTGEQFPKKRLSEREAFEWIQTNYPEVFARSLHSRALVGAAWNIVDFIEAALQCAKRGQAAPAYALLRRPFRDDLSIIELLAHDPTTLVEALKAGHKSISNLLNYPATQSPTKPIVSAVSMLPYGWAHDPEFIYNLRYDRTDAYSLEGYWSRALHVATSARGIESGPFTLNMYFPTHESTQTTLVDFGHRTGALLHYVVDLVDALAVRQGGADEAHARMRATARILARVWFEQEIAGNEFGHFFPFAWERITRARARCTGCGHERDVDGEVTKALSPEGYTCGRCNLKLDVSNLDVLPFVRPVEGAQSDVALASTGLDCVRR